LTSTQIVLFDWDGTLIDSLEIKIRNAARLFEQELSAQPAQVESAYRRFSGIPRRQLFDAILTECRLPALDEQRYNQLSRRFSEMNLITLSDPRNPKLVPTDTRDALEILLSLDYPMYVSSSADTQEINAIARAMRLDKFFRAILGSVSEFTKGKPHIQYVLRQEKAGLDRIVFVGDEPADIALGHEAGVITITKAGTHSVEKLIAEGAEYVVTSLCEIPTILQERIIQRNQRPGGL